MQNNVEWLKQIRAYMARERLSQTEFARLIKAPEATVSRWLTGKQTISELYGRVLRQHGIVT